MIKEPETSITLPQSMWNVVATGLAELPYKVALPVFNAVNEQLAERMKQEAEKASEKSGGQEPT